MKRLLLLAVLGVALTTAIATAAAEAATGTIDARAQLSHDHTMATVTGTLNCNPLVSGNGFLTVTVQQVVGRLPIQGGGGTFGIPCTGTSQPWSVTTQTTGTYFAGPARVTASFSAFGGNFPPVIDNWGQQSTVRLLP